MTKLAVIAGLMLAVLATGASGGAAEGGSGPQGRKASSMSNRWRSPPDAW